MSSKVLVALGVVALTVPAALALLFRLNALAAVTDVGGIILGVAGAVAAVSVLGHSGPLTHSRAGLAWAAFLGWLLLSVAISGRVWAGLAGEVTSLLGWFSLVALTAVVLAARTDGASIEGLLIRWAPWVVAGQSLLVALELALHMEPGGTLRNSSYLGEALLVLLPFTFQGLGERPDRARFVRLGVALAGIVVLIAGGSRVAGLVAVIWFAWALLRRSPSLGRMRVYLVAGTLVVVALAGITFAGAEIAGTFDRATLGGRPEMWQAAVQSTFERPLVGYGADGFWAGAAIAATPARAKTGATFAPMPGSADPHGLALWVLVSSGFVGLALFGWWVIEVAVAGSVHARDQERVAWRLWAVAGPAVVFLTAPADIHVLTLFALGLGVALSDGAVGHEARLLPPVAAKWLAAGLCVVSALWVANLAVRLPLEVPGPERSATWAPRAVWFSDVWRADAHLAYLASLHVGYAVQAGTMPAQPQTGLLMSGRAVSADTRNPEYPLAHARALDSRGGSPAQVERAYLESIRRWPLNPLARAEYAIVLIGMGRLDDAQSQLQIAELERNPDTETQGAILAARDALVAASGIR